MSRSDFEPHHADVISQIRDRTVELISYQVAGAAGPAYDFHPRLSSWGVKNGLVQSVKKEPGGKLIFDARYTFDDYGRRYTPRARPTKTDRFAVFFGDSLAFGEGVNDAETLPAYFEKLNPGYRAYNYGFMGYGPQQMLARLRETPVLSELHEKKGMFVFSLRDSAVAIAAGKVPWCGGFPRYGLNGSGALVDQGNFPMESCSAHWVLPAELNDSDFKLVVKMLVEIKREIKKLRTGLEFYVLVQPVTTLASKLVPMLEKAGLRVIDLSTADMEHQLHHAGRLHDGNHTGAGNKFVAKKVTEALLAEKFGASKFLLSRNHSKATEKTERLYDWLFNHAFQIPLYEVMPFDDAADLIVRALQEQGLSFESEGRLSFEELMHFTEKAFRFKHYLLRLCSRLRIVGRPVKPVPFKTFREHVFKHDWLWPINQRYFYEEYFLTDERRYFSHVHRSQLRRRYGDRVLRSRL